MNKYIITAILLFMSISISAQKESMTFKGHFYNKEYDIYLIIDLYDMDVEVPNHSMFGNLPGYLGKRLNNFYWLVTSGKIKNDSYAELDMINDFGSEDTRVSLKQINDSTLIFKQEEGSTMKIANNGKWQKLPKELKLKKKL
ncbi:MAG: hypothetical protein Q4C43_00805 [Prevotella sp.]|nr:hypothetical protein [Prevotella sp.]